MQSLWWPDDEELAILNAGGCVVLNVLGAGHPPVHLTVWLDLSAGGVGQARADSPVSADNHATDEDAANGMAPNLTHPQPVGSEATRIAELEAALNAIHDCYKTLSEEALEAGILFEHGPPKPHVGAALLKARAALPKPPLTGGA